jgi:ATPase family associated with various cellular activities (AAA)
MCSGRLASVGLASQTAKFLLCSMPCTVKVVSTIRFSAERYEYHIRVLLSIPSVQVVQSAGSIAGSPSSCQQRQHGGVAPSLARCVFNQATTPTVTALYTIATLTNAGKTMLAKAVAHHTTAAFIRVVGSEFVQKYLGEGPRMVRDVFRLAKENEPAIIFIDEVLHQGLGSSVQGLRAQGLRGPGCRADSAWSVVTRACQCVN